MPRLTQQLLASTGTRFGDLIDHIQLPDIPKHQSALAATGFHPSQENDANETSWCHPEGLFPRIRLVASGGEAIAMGVDNLEDFLAANEWTDRSQIEGAPGQPLRFAQIAGDSEVPLLVFERHGKEGFTPTSAPPEQLAAAARHREEFSARQRDFDGDADGFAHAVAMIDAAIRDLGPNWTCDLFFQAEREYWQERNEAARVQRRRQDALGIGWANHDHHTYRSSRESFPRLIAVLEKMGFVCRERFHAGQAAGWGAQVLEQPVCRMVIFADVDLQPEEITGDIAHRPLPPTTELGTIGLWCRLHGEAFLEAGLHHLECQFDFDAARAQLADEGVVTMAPFTDLPYLKQAFTEAETWSVAQHRIDATLADGLITRKQAVTFAQKGAPGSHLEILERNDGYKGFNQTGVSDIIQRTDPRRR